MQAHSVRLDEILRRQPGIGWQEGVSVVQAICRALPDAGTGDARFPLPAEVSISAEGVVSLLCRPSGFPGVTAAGRLLGEMLQADVPVRLRQIQSDAVAPTPTFDSVRDFSAALAYFERPDAQTLIEQLYVRAAQAGVAPEVPLDLAALEDFLPEGGSRRAPATAAATPAGADQHTAELRARLQDAPTYPPARRARNVWTAAAVGAVVIVSGALLAYGRERLMPERQAYEVAPGEATSAPESTTPIGAPAGGGPAALKTRAPKSRVIPAADGDDGSTTPPAAAAEAGTKSTPSGASGWIVSATEIQPYLPDSRPTAALPIVSLHPGDRAESALTGPDASADFIYSHGNPDVIPPVAIRPHLPSEPPADSAPDHLMVLELVVSTKGDVESVRLLTVPRTVNDFMIVSAAKAWLFAPAKRNGRPVKYKQRIRFVVP
jgi:hypothetical protein